MYIFSLFLCTLMGWVHQSKKDATKRKFVLWIRYMDVYFLCILCIIYIRRSRYETSIYTFIHYHSIKYTTNHINILLETSINLNKPGRNSIFSIYRHELNRAYSNVFANKVRIELFPYGRQYWSQLVYWLWLRSHFAELFMCLGGYIYGASPKVEGRSQGSIRPGDESVGKTRARWRGSKTGTRISFRDRDQERSWFYP